MKVFAGWYVVGQRRVRLLSLVAGPVASRERAEALLGPAEAVARSIWGLDLDDTFAVAWLAFPSPVQNEEANAALWIKPEFQEYDA